jgi:hypothetical protein
MSHGARQAWIALMHAWCPHPRPGSSSTMPRTIPSRLHWIQAAISNDPWSRWQTARLTAHQRGRAGVRWRLVAETAAALGIWAESVHWSMGFATAALVSARQVGCTTDHGRDLFVARKGKQSRPNISCAGSGDPAGRRTEGAVEPARPPALDAPCAGVDACSHLGCASRLADEAQSDASA